MGLRRRIDAALAAAREAVRAADLARAGIDPDDLAEANLRPASLGALVVGLSADQVAAVAPAIRAAARPDDAFTVLLTDRADIAVYQMDGFVAEYLAPLPALSGASPGRDADLYLRRRLALIRGKWNLRSVLVFGDAAARLTQDGTAASTDLLPDIFVREEVPPHLQK